MYNVVTRKFLERKRRDPSNHAVSAMLSARLRELRQSSSPRERKSAELEKLNAIRDKQLVVGCHVATEDGKISGVVTIIYPRGRAIEIRTPLGLKKCSPTVLKRVD